MIVFYQQTLRRMCYLTIKEMANISEDVIIVTSRSEAHLYVIYCIHNHMFDYSLVDSCMFA